MILPNIAAIGQRDPKWASKKLGTSSATIADAGCVLCCAVIISRFYGKDIWPDWLNEQMKRVGGYADGNLWLWHKLTEIFPDIRVHDLIDCYTVPAPLERIDQRLEQGHPVIVCVDFDPKPGVQTHFVVIFGKDERGYYIADPWYNDIALLNERYGDPAKAIYAIRMYDGPLSPLSASNPDLDSLKKRLEEIEASVRTLRNDLSGLLGEMESWQEWRDTANERLDELEKKWREVKVMDLKVMTK
ncbi:MAG: C39 family peptidase [Candidatus Omnitrophica bacterium]|nr:C39 family peptidase [Candidatus Omnitrophota bacterium]